MKKIVLFVVLLLMSLSVSAQSYSFSKEDGQYSMDDMQPAGVVVAKITQFDKILDTYSFFLVISDPMCADGTNKLAGDIYNNCSDRQACIDIIIALEDGSIIVLENRNAEAKNDYKVALNMTMKKDDFLKLKKSNILALKTTGNYYIDLEGFRSAATLSAMDSQ